MGRSLVGLVASLILASCSGGGAPGQSQFPTGVASAGRTGIPTGTVASVVCEWYSQARPSLVDAATASFTGKNPAVPLRTGIDRTRAIAARAQDQTERRDLTTLADTLDAVAMRGGSFTDWDPAYEAFFVKYATRCGQPIAS